MKKVLRSPAFSVFLMLLAAVLLATGGVGTARAALNIQSGIYTSQFQLSDIGVALTEEGEIISHRDYNSSTKNGSWIGNNDGLLMDGIAATDSKCLVERAGDTSFKVGKVYPLSLGVANTGTIAEYVRVTVYKYWVSNPATSGDHGVHGWFNGNGSKNLSLDPKLIEIIPDLSNRSATAAPGWTLDTSSTTAERTVFYYNGILNPNATAQFAAGVRVSPEVLKYVKTVTEGNTTKYVYAYDGLGFVIETQVDAVQTRHADNARTSAWGRTGA